MIPDEFEENCPEGTLFFRCNDCKTVRPIYYFHKHNKQWFGILESCTDCTRVKRNSAGGKKPASYLKWCISCEQDKPKSEFHRDRNSRDGLNAACRSCHLSRTRRYREALSADPERVSQFRRKQTIRTAFEHNLPVPDMDIKACSKCKEIKPIDEFYNATSSSDGKNHRCISCHRKRSTTDRDPADILKYRQDRTETLVHEHNLAAPATDIKQCTKCVVIKGIDEFNNNRRSPDGKESQCRDCRRGNTR